MIWWSLNLCMVWWSIMCIVMSNVNDIFDLTSLSKLSHCPSSVVYSSLLPTHKIATVSRSFLKRSFLWHAFLSLSLSLLLPLLCSAPTLGSSNEQLGQEEQCLHCHLPGLQRCRPPSKEPQGPDATGPVSRPSPPQAAHQVQPRASQGRQNDGTGNIRQRHTCQDPAKGR